MGRGVFRRSEAEPCQRKGASEQLLFCGPYRVNLSNSTVNDEILQIDQIDNLAKVILKLAWHRPADASVPAAYYVLDLGTNGIVVSFDNDEYDGRKFAGTARRLRCTRPLRENS
jgi:hypothetical protein